MQEIQAELRAAPGQSGEQSQGGIGEKPVVREGRIEIRECLSLTVDFDHDLVDGTPAARFMQKFRELIESGYGL